MTWNQPCETPLSHSGIRTKNIRMILGCKSKPRQQSNPLLYNLGANHHFSRLLSYGWGYKGPILFNPRVPMGHLVLNKKLKSEMLTDDTLRVITKAFPITTRTGAAVAEWFKLLACEARGPGFDSPPRHLNFRDWLSPASKSRYGLNTAKVT